MRQIRRIVNDNKSKNFSKHGQRCGKKNPVNVTPGTKEDSEDDIKVAHNVFYNGLMV